MKASIKKVFWHDVRDSVAERDPILAQLMDTLDPGNKYPLFLAQYPYSSTVVKNGLFYVPTPDGKLAPIDGDDVDPEVKKHLLYDTKEIPPGFILGNSLELYCEKDNLTYARHLFKPGYSFGWWKCLDSTPSFHPSKMFSIQAGARSMFMLPNIGNAVSHKYLQQAFNIPLGAPKSILDHQAIFKQLAQHPDLNCQWHTSLLFFSQQFYEKIATDDAFLAFYNHLLAKAWKSTAYWRNQQFYDFAISLAQANRNLKPNPYLVDTLKHLVAIVAGAAQGFTPAQDDIAGPISLLQQVYSGMYKRLQYLPIIFHPSAFDGSLAPGTSLYYSFQFPITMEFSPKSRKLSTTIHELGELKYLLDIFLQELREQRLMLEGTSAKTTLLQAQFDFYHTKSVPHSGILMTEDLENTDKNITHTSHAPPDARFPSMASFLRGCIRIKQT